MRSQRKTRKTKARKGGAQEIKATILDQASTQVLRIEVPPGASLIADQNTMAYMSGELKAVARTGGATNGGGFMNAFKRAVTGQSFFVNEFTNPTNTVAEITLSPFIPSAIAEITIQPDEEWKVHPGCVLAATPNVRISGSLNIFDNFRASFVTQTAVYSTVGLKEGSTTPGRAWISGFGGIEQRTIKPTQTPFILNNGTFLAMPAKYWNAYVDVGTPGSLLDSFMTNIGFVLKIQDKSKGSVPPPSIPVYIQSINVHNFKQMIRTIASAEAQKVANKKTIQFGEQ